MKNITELQCELSEVKSRINKLTPDDSYFNALLRSFHLGMVGGSGRNTYRLNKRREAAMDKSIERSKILCELYTKRDNLEKQISDIETGVTAKRELSVIDKRIEMAKYWNGLKAGDELNLGNTNGNPVIAKKSSKSVITTNGTKWTVSEVIGREAAKFI